MWAWLLLALFALTCNVCQGQAAIPDRLPELKYPPIARVARVQGDVIVSFQQTPEGKAVDVMPPLGPPMLEGIAVANAEGWHFAAVREPSGRVQKVTFHFQLDPPNDGYDRQPMMKVELDEVALLVNPVLLDTGKRFFAERTQTRSFELGDTHATPTGIVVNSYKAAGSSKNQP